MVTDDEVNLSVGTNIPEPLKDVFTDEIHAEFQVNFSWVLVETGELIQVEDVAIENDKVWLFYTTGINEHR